MTSRLEFENVNYKINSSNKEYEMGVIRDSTDYTRELKSHLLDFYYLIF